MTRLLQRLAQHPPRIPGHAGVSGRQVAAACGLLVALAAVPATLEAQFFPSTSPAEVFADDFAPPDSLDAWTAVRWSGADAFVGLWEPSSDVFGCATGDSWLDHAKETNGQSDQQSVLVINQSRLGNPGYDPTEWQNIRIEADFRADIQQTAFGVVWGASTWDNPPFGATDVEEAYLFSVEDLPTRLDAIDLGARARWRLYKRLGGTDTQIGTALIELDPGNNELLTLYQSQCYQLRIDFFCGNFRAQVRRFACTGTDACAYNDCGGEWCTIADWTDTSGAPLGPGVVGLWSGGTDPATNTRVDVDNVHVSSWGQSCFQVCDEWSTWTDDWDSGQLGAEGRQALEFKLLYGGALLDYTYGRGPTYEVDLDVHSPSVMDPENVTLNGFCNGWNLLVDLPPPASPSNFAEVAMVLEPMASAVDLVNDGSSLSWQDSYDPDPASPTYDPIPILTRGTTPIANSLTDAYNWYQESVTTGLWSNDPLAACRLWYVVFITDGEESCGLNACDPGQAAWKFDNPAAWGGIGQPVQVFMIGFSEEFDPMNPSPLQCVSEITDGQFFAATNASQLSAALYEIINRMDESDRSFIPFKVSPPPSTAGGSGTANDYLALFPLFRPQKDESIWTGNLYAFKLDTLNPTLPATGDCQIDLSLVAWDAATSLAAQLALPTPARNIYIGTEAASVWTRHRIEEVGTDSTLRDDFKDKLGLPALPTDLEAQEVVNFIRDIWDNPMALDPPPQNPPRPTGYAVLGDIFHSQPVSVSPPNNPMFYYDYGFVQPGEAGAHDYELFMNQHARRRRVALAGANDGMLHAFDAGFYDRDDGGTYDDQHDLGTGLELFAHVPVAVMDKLWVMTYGTEQQYLVDGQIAVSDVFISPDGGTSPREWRTVALSTMRRGGRGVVALDMTQPDPTSGSPDYQPVETDLPGCTIGTVGDCSAEYPRLMWEFKDESDADANCPLGMSGDQCSPYWDLGWTWSKPAIARIAVYNGGNPGAPDDTFVAFFGGGWDKQESDLTGNFVYGVDIETGAVVYKQPIGVSVPGSFAAHDSDLNGFHDRVYFGDSDGSLWRIGYPAPNDSASTGVGAATLTRIFDFRADFTARQQFFMRPIIVPALFDGSAFTWAITLGSGDRANLQLENGDVSAYFFVLDVGDGTTRSAADLLAIDYSALSGVSGDASCATNALDPANGSYGWYMTMRPNERVNFETTVVAGHVLFSTFEPGDDLVAMNPPNLCGDGGGGGDPIPPGTPICRAAGIGRAYDLWFKCGDGTTIEFDQFITGNTSYTIGGTTYVTFTPDIPIPGYTQEFVNPTGYTVTNWRQE